MGYISYDHYADWAECQRQSRQQTGYDPKVPSHEVIQQGDREYTG
jgi:hypothetical protein